MKTEGLINLSQAVAHGNLRRVKNFNSEKQGIVVNVNGDGLTVNVGTSTEIWAYNDCEDITWQ